MPSIQMVAQIAPILRLVEGGLWHFQQLLLQLMLLGTLEHRG